MFRILYRFVNKIDYKQKKSLLNIISLSIFSSITEILTVISIVFLGKIFIDSEDASFIFVYSLFDHGLTEVDFKVYLSFLIFSLILVSTLLSFYTNWRLAILGQKIGYSIGNSLFYAYSVKSLAFHQNNSISSLISKIQVETERIASGLITPLALVINKVIFLLITLIFLILYDPFVALVISLIVGLVYFITFLFVNKLLSLHGIQISILSRLRFENLQNFFGGVRELIVLDRKKYLTHCFYSNSLQLSYSKGVSLVISQIPKYAIEFLIYLSLTLFILYAFVSPSLDFQYLITTAIIYMLLGIKLLPSFQQIYRGISQITNNLNAFLSIENDLSVSEEAAHPIASHFISESLHHEALVFDNVSFHYSSDTSLFDNLSFSFKANSLNALVGKSGSGKSTILDLVLGLRIPNSGSIVINSNIFNNNLIGYVPQNIFIASSSIKSNIGFGLNPNEIDDDKVSNAISISGLQPILSELPEGIDTILGDDGAGLSGGQLQRIGFARALYNNPSILILDEPFAGLDHFSEISLIKTLKDLSSRYTVILITHNLNSLDLFDHIVFIDKGRLLIEGGADDISSFLY